MRNRLPFYLLLSSMTLLANASDLPTLNVIDYKNKLDISNISEQTVTPDTTRYTTYLGSFTSQPYVNVQSTGRQQQSSIINGFTQYRNEQFLDGVRLNNATMRDGPNQYSSTIDGYSIDHSTLSFGQSTLLHAPDSFGAEVNALTLKQTDFTQDKSFRATSLYHYASAESANIGHVAVNGNYGKLGIQSGYTVSDYGNLWGGTDTGKQVGTGYKSQSANARLDYHLTEKTSLTALYQFYDSPSAARTHATLDGNTLLGTAPGSYLFRNYSNSRHLGYVGFDSKEVPFLDSLDGKVSYQHIREDQDRQKPLKARTTQGFDDSILGAQLHGKKSTFLGTFQTGVDYYKDMVGSYEIITFNGTSEQGIPGPVANNSSYDTLGTYVSGNFNLVPDMTYLDVTSRYDHASSHFGYIVDDSSPTGSRLGNPQSWSAFTSGAKLSTFFTSEHDYSASFGVNQHVRMPTLFDLTGDELARSSDVQTPSTTPLSPEHGLTYALEGRYSNNQLNTGIRLFRTNLSNILVRVPTGRKIDGSTEVVAVNNGNGHTEGVSLDAKYLFTKGWVSTAFSYTYGVMSEYNKGTWLQHPASRINPASGNIQIHYDVDTTLYAESMLRVVGAQGRLSDRDLSDTQRIPIGGSKEYALWDIKLSYTPIKNVQLSGAVENLLNKDYRAFGSGINGAGRNFIVQLELKL